ncbi:MAG: RNA methyltransferase [Planctomycetota bacterium]|nr:RNA methyltransferase [Planctomycetota bacterium]
MIQRIDEIEDTRLDDYRNITDAELLRSRDLFMAEGRMIVRSVLRGGRFRPRSVLVSSAALEAMHDLLSDRGGPVRCPVYTAPQAIINQIVGFDLHRGCLAAVERGRCLSLEDLTALAGEGPATMVVLEDVNNHDNVGGVFRNAAAFGAAGVLLSPGCVDPLYRKSVRVSMGGVLTVPFARSPQHRWPGDLHALRAAGFTILAMTPAPSAVDIRSLGRELPIPARCALVLGAEGAGLSPAALGSADMLVRIPILGAVDSLNVATAGAIALHALGAGVGAACAPGAPVVAVSAAASAAPGR